MCKKKKKRGAVRFSLFCLWACLARFRYLHQPASSVFFCFFVTALKQVDDKNINLPRHIVWHTYFDSLPSSALYSIITHSYSLPDAPRVNTTQKGAERQVCIVALCFCYNHVLIGLEWKRGFFPPIPLELREFYALWLKGRKGNLAVSISQNYNLTNLNVSPEFCTIAASMWGSVNRFF